jgi:hypothetical protein
MQDGTLMETPAAARPKAPYGLSFALSDLVYMRSWAYRQGMNMQVLLDQVMNGAEFEEFLLIQRGGCDRRALTVWRTTAGVVAQESGGQPKLFSGPQPVTLHYATLFASPPRPVRPSLWRQLLFRA